MSRIKAIPRPDRPGTFQLIGTIPGFERIRKTAKAHTQELADQEAVILEARLMREAIHGRPDRRGDRLFAEVAEAYLDADVRHPQQIRRVLAIVRALGNVKVGDIDQAEVDRIKRVLIKSKTPARNTVKAVVNMPLRAVLNFGWRRSWCDAVPPFELPKVREVKKTEIILPLQAEKIIAATANHAKPIFITMFGIGSRVTETLKLRWEDVDLKTGRASLIQKGGRLRHVTLPPAVIAALAAIPGPHDRGFVFKNRLGRPFNNTRVEEGKGGGQLNKLWDGALRRAGYADRNWTRHTMRHSFASWHLAVYRNPKRLQEDGGWERLEMIERYTHLMPIGHESEIEKFWGYAPGGTKMTPRLGDVLQAIEIAS